MWKGVPDDLLDEEVVLPAQIPQGWRRAMTPERRLAFAVLWAGVSDLLKYRFSGRRRHQRLYMDAYIWVESRESEWEFSFERLCVEFGLDVDEARRSLLDVTRPAPSGDAWSEEAGFPIGGFDQAA